MEKRITTVSPHTAHLLKEIGFPQRSFYYLHDDNTSLFNAAPGTTDRPSAFQLHELFELLPTPAGKGLAFYTGIARNATDKKRYYCRIMNDKTIMAYSIADALGKAIIRAHRKHGKFWETPVNNQ